MSPSVTLLLDPFDKLVVLSRQAVAIRCWDGSLQIDCATTGILPFTTSFILDYIEVCKANSGAASIASTNERIDILFTSERGAVDVSYEVAMRSKVDMG